MADTVTTKWLYPPKLDQQGYGVDGKTGHRRIIVQLTGISDSTGETDVKKIVRADLKRSDGQVPETLAVEKIQYDVRGFNSIVLEWDHSPDETIAVISGDGQDSISYPGGLQPQCDGGTGDILLTTNGASANDSYNITLTVRLK